MQALEIIVGVVNKRFLQSLYKKRKGRKGYGKVRIIRLLVFLQAEKITENKKAVRFLKKYPKIKKKLGFREIPNRRSIRRWKRDYALILEQVVTILGDKYSQMKKINYTAIDSAPLQDSKDPEARSGKSSRGWFKGFKLHINCDDLAVPLRAKVTTGNVHDSKPAEELFVESPVTLADAAYDSKKLREIATEKKTHLIADENLRRSCKKKERPLILKKLRYIVEQSLSLLKDKTMKHTWHRVKGFAQKITYALSAVILVQALAIYTVAKTGFPELKIDEVML